MGHWSGHEGDGRAEPWAELRSPFRYSGCCHKPAPHIHSFVETGAVECTRRFVEWVEQKAMDYLDRSIFVVEKQKKSSLVLALVVERKEAIPDQSPVVRRCT